MSGELRYETLGSTPNRVFVIQYKNWRRFATPTGIHTNFQIRLAETDNSIEIHYGASNTNATNTSQEVGLRGPTNAFATNVNNRLVATGGNWATSAPGASNFSTCAFQNATFPANGQVYRWFAPSCAVPSGNVTTAPNCATDQYTATVNVTALGDALNVDIVSSIHGSIATGVGIGSYPSNPNTFGTPEIFTVVDNGNALCYIPLGPVNYVDNDNTCFPTNASHPVSGTLPITNVPFCVNDPGSSLGVDVFVQSVDLIISHTWNDDMDIQLINPNGTIVDLVFDRFGNGDNLGNPAFCPGGLFTLQDGGDALNTVNTSNVVGTFNPEQPLSNFNDASNPNGEWTLRVTDDNGLNDGGVRFVRVNLTTCPDPVLANNSAPVNNCGTGEFTFNVNVTNDGPGTVDISTDVHGVIHTGVNNGSYAVPATIWGTPVTVTVTSTSLPACTTTLAPVTSSDADEVCHPASRFPVSASSPLNVPFCVSDPGTALGTDVYVQSVDLIISHTWNDDMDIQLINPNGTIVDLVFDRFGNGDNLGHPSLCPGGLFTLAAGGTALNNTNTSNVVGTYAPEQPLSTLHDASDPNGTWILRVTDDNSADDGGVRYVRVNLLPCQSPTAGGQTIVPDCANDEYSIDVNLTSLGTSASIDLTNSFDANVVTANATGIWTVGPFPNGTSVTVTLEATNALCDVSLAQQLYNCPPPNDECANAIAVNCNSITNGNTTFATAEVPLPGLCGTSVSAPGLWYTVVGAGGNMTISLCGSVYDTKLGVYTTPDCVAYTCIAGNDDAVLPSACAGSLQSEVSFLSTLGTTYHIVVNGFAGSTGAFTMEVACLADADSDGVIDIDDNCVNDANPDQADSDEDGIGDVCDDCPLAVDGIANFDDNTCSCNLGYYATITDMDGNDVITACTICPPGSFCADGLVAVECPAGRYQDQPGQIGCIDCDAGSANASTGQTACSACPPGRFSANSGQQLCDLCPANTFNPDAGQTECLACPVGESSVAGSVACTPAAAAQDYRTQADGNWSTLEVWEEFDGVDWVDADVVPTSVHGIITITHVVTSNTNRTVDEVVVSAGSLNISGGIFTVNDGTGTDLECTANLAISGGTVTNGGTISISSGAFAWTGGTIGGAGTFSLDAGSTGSWSTGGKVLNTALTNNGMVTWSGGQIGGQRHVEQYSHRHLDITFTGGSQQLVFLNNAGTLNYTGAGVWSTNSAP
ncbi:MAG: proprotein convertase P-domain-containing protein [Flavobacteriales bacterium]|nr:proprotein convertase P-domain-containing protein [Flavobacteriales bacterium]